MIGLWVPMLREKFFRNKIKRRFKYFYYRFVRIDNSPERVAKGLAVGIFYGCTPFLGVHMLASFATAALIHGNKILAMIATWIMNPLTIVPLVYLDFRVGKYLLKSSLEAEFSKENLTSMMSMMEMGWDFFWILSAGGIVVGCICSFLTYFISKPLFIHLRKFHLLSRYHGRKKYS